MERERGWDVGRKRKGRRGKSHSLERLEGRHRRRCDPNSSCTAIFDCRSSSCISSRVRSWRRNTQHHGTPFNQSAPQMAGHTPSMEVIEDGHWKHIRAHACHHAPHHEPLTQRHILHHTTHIHNSRRFAFPRSASIIALNTASENVQQYNLDVSNEWATPTARAPSTTKCAPPCLQFQLDPIHHGTYCNP